MWDLQVWQPDKITCIAIFQTLKYNPILSCSAWPEAVQTNLYLHLFLTWSCPSDTTYNCLLLLNNNLFHTAQLVLTSFGSYDQTNIKSNTIHFKSQKIFYSHLQFVYWIFTLILWPSGLSLTLEMALPQNFCPILLLWNLYWDFDLIQKKSDPFLPIR